MRKFISVLVLSAFLGFLGCNTVGDNLPLVNSTWKLVETRISIGGPAVFTPTDREEFLVFLSNTKVRNSNGWCGEGSAEEVNYNENGTILTGCNGSGTLTFEINRNTMIIRNPSCIEACDYKYVMVK